MTAKISFQGVGKTFSSRGRQLSALEDITFEVRRGEFLALVGPSGCGKSTLLDLLAGLSAPTTGEILVDGAPVTGPGLDRGVVFQQYALLPWRTAQANVEFGLEAKGVARRERADRARHFLDLVGLSGFGDRYPHELSGGMKQRVAIARSLAFDPDVLLMDEPFAALDAQTRDSLQDELLRIWERTNKTILFITHGIDEAVYLGQRVAVMTSRPGRIKKIIDIPLGSRTETEDLRSDPTFARYRHEIWTLLRDEVVKAQAQEHAADHWGTAGERRPRWHGLARSRPPRRGRRPGPAPTSDHQEAGVD
ncbi:ABC transporter ATP-binding protein [Planosporangium thailandense]|uniref:ABC transporter ATP-binding protein n=1 Tax=Planosporangium thailandense TaxID=765197 RepID=A0ABX0Y7J8_9ACTN|nr:ABC transporter ATP-binding protein [Planosporangium thailandense]NJC74107.1 ABC transporter ATP-binding protein [Planosporangium thailandense]